MVQSYEDPTVLSLITFLISSKTFEFKTIGTDYSLTVEADLDLLWLG